VVWHSGRPEPLPTAPIPATPAAAPMPQVGAAMDRAELLRLVKAG